MPVLRSCCRHKILQPRAMYSIAGGDLFAQYILHYFFQISKIRSKDSEAISIILIYSFWSQVHFCYRCESLSMLSWNHISEVCRSHACAASPIIPLPWLSTTMTRYWFQSWLKNRSCAKCRATKIETKLPYLLE